MKLFSRFFFAAALTAVLSIPAAFAQQSDADLQASVQKALGNSSFKGVQVSVQGGEATLTGSVDVYDAKARADQKAHHVKGIVGVRNEIQVAGADVPDAQLQDKLVKAVSYDRVGYGIVFNNLMVGVENGAVTIDGKVRDYSDRSSAIAIVETTPGVKDVIDEIDVAPVSNFDDELRVRLARAIYGHSGFQKYALDPQAPIRIIVENGNVELAGVVLNEGDRQIAYIQANSVPGVFSVRNKLMVASDMRD